jgi:hypothetical protein
MLGEEIARLNDWSVLAEVKCHRAINDELGEVRRQIGVFEAQIDDLVKRQWLCEARLEAGKVSSQVKYLEHLAPHVPQIAKH